MVRGVHGHVQSSPGPHPCPPVCLCSVLCERVEAGARHTLTGWTGGSGSFSTSTSTNLTDMDPKSQVMQEEIFGLVMHTVCVCVCVRVCSLEEDIQFSNQAEKPLALYLFSPNDNVSLRVLLPGFLGLGHSFYMHTGSRSPQARGSDCSFSAH